MKPFAQNFTFSLRPQWVLTSLMHYRSSNDGKFENGVIVVSLALR